MTSALLRLKAQVAGNGMPPPPAPTGPRLPTDAEARAVTEPPPAATPARPSGLARLKLQVQARTSPAPIFVGEPSPSSSASSAGRGSAPWDARQRPLTAQWSEKRREQARRCPLRIVIEERLIPAWNAVDAASRGESPGNNLAVAAALLAEAARDRWLGPSERGEGPAWLERRLAARAEMDALRRAIDALAVTQAELTWVTGPPAVDRSGIARYTHIIRAPDDPERTDIRTLPSELRDQTAEWRRKLKKSSVADWKRAIWTLLSYGAPRTFNAIGVELVDKTADLLLDLPPERALWALVAEGRVEHTLEAPILFRAVAGAAGPGDGSEPSPPSGGSDDEEEPELTEDTALEALRALPEDAGEDAAMGALEGLRLPADDDEPDPMDLDPEGEGSIVRYVGAQHPHLAGFEGRIAGLDGPPWSVAWRERGGALRAPEVRDPPRYAEHELKLLNAFSPAFQRTGETSGAPAPTYGRADYADRRERRIDRLHGAGKRRLGEADAAWNRSSEIAKRFEFGQPILLGHHSAPRALRDQKRMHDAMSRSVKLGDEGKELLRRAQAAATNQMISSDDPNAPERIREKLAMLRADQALWVAMNRAIRATLKEWQPKVDEVLRATEPERRRIDQEIRAIEGRFHRYHEPSNAPLKAEIRELKRQQRQPEMAVRLQWAEAAIERHRADFAALGVDVSKLLVELAAATAPDDFKRIGVPDFKLKNNASEIRRLEKRLEAMAGQATRGAPDPVTVGEAVVSWHTDDNRVRITFPRRVSQDVYEKLQGRGFKRTPSVGENVFQRLANESAWSAALSFAREIATKGTPP